MGTRILVTLLGANGRVGFGDGDAGGLGGMAFEFSAGAVVVVGIMKEDAFGTNAGIMTFPNSSVGGAFERVGCRDAPVAER